MYFNRHLIGNLSIIGYFITVRIFPNGHKTRNLLYWKESNLIEWEGSLCEEDCPRTPKSRYIHTSNGSTILMGHRYNIQLCTPR